MTGVIIMPAEKKLTKPKLASRQRVKIKYSSNPTPLSGSNTVDRILTNKSVPKQMSDYSDTSKWVENPDPNYQEYTRSPKKYKTFNSNPDPNYTPYQNTAQSTSRSARLISRIKTNPAAQKMGRVLRNPLLRKLSTVGAFVEASSYFTTGRTEPSFEGAANISDRVIGYSIYKPIKVIPRNQNSIIMGGANVKPLTGAKDKRGVMMYPIQKVEPRNPYIYGTPLPLKAAVNTTGAESSKTSRGGVTPKPLQAVIPDQTVPKKRPSKVISDRQSGNQRLPDKVIKVKRKPKGLTGNDLGFLNIKPLSEKPRPIPTLRSVIGSASGIPRPAVSRVGLSGESPSMSMFKSNIDETWRRRLGAIGR
jgi:hypothetical protein